VVLSWRLRGTSRDGQHSGWVGDDEAVSMATWSWLERWHQFAAADRYQNAVDCQRWICLQSLSLAALDWQMCQCHSLSPSCLYSVSVFSVFGNVVNAILLSTADEMLSGGHLVQCTRLRIWCYLPESELIKMMVYGRGVQGPDLRKILRQTYDNLTIMTELKIIVRKSYNILGYGLRTILRTWLATILDKS